MTKTIFAGNGRFALITLKTLIENEQKPSLVLMLPDKRTLREKEKNPLEIKDLVTKNHIPVKEIENKEAFHYEIKKENPDIVTIASFGVIIPSKTLSLSRFVNLHPSLLPKYRGPSPIQYAILNGEKKSGISIFKMTAGVDEGPVLLKSEVPFHSKITYLEAEEMLAREGGEVLAKNINGIIEEKITSAPQNNEKATYTKVFKKTDGKIDWSESAEIIERKVRALNPWPGTFGRMGDKYFKVIEAETQEQTGNGPFGTPGKVYLGTNHTIAVQTGKDFLLIKNLQIEGKTSTNSKDFLQGNMSSMGIILT